MSIGKSKTDVMHTGEPKFILQLSMFYGNDGEELASTELSIKDFINLMAKANHLGWSVGDYLNEAVNRMTP